MKVLVVTHYYPAHGGGIEHAAGRLLQALDGGGDSFTWAASACDATPAMPGVTPMPMRVLNGMERKFGLPLPFWPPRELLRLWRTVREHDAVWLHDTLYLGQLVALAAAKRYRKRLLITQHIGLVPYRNPVLRFLYHVAVNFVSIPMLRLADQVGFVSEHVADYFCERAQLPHARLVPNGVDAEIFHPAPPPANDPAVLLFVGRFVEKKGLPVLRELARQLPQLRFVFAGHGPLDPAGWGLPNVRVERGLSGAALAALYRQADLLVLSSVGEGFPLVVQEALACGLPVLCGEETAQGSSAALPWLTALPVDPQRVPETAATWRAAILAWLPGRQETPERRSARAAFAAATWNWDKAATAYHKMLHGNI